MKMDEGEIGWRRATCMALRYDNYDGVKPFRVSFGEELI